MLAARLDQFTPEFEYSKVVLTREALLADKADVLPGNSFVLGYDTAARVLDQKYYGGDMNLYRALDRIRNLECSFIVVGRVSAPEVGEGKFLTLADLRIPDGYNDLFVGLGEDDFRVDLSSSQIRASNDARKSRPADVDVKKVIFLDVDGVLHPLTQEFRPVGSTMTELSIRAEDESANSGREGYQFPVCSGEFSKECLERLASIIRETGASIVLSSTWRETPWQTAAVNRQLALAGIPPALDSTPVLPYDPSNPGNRRGREIMDWVGRHAVVQFVVLDDSKFSLGSDTLDAAHMVRTRATIGLCSEDTERATAILMGKIPSES